MILEFKVLARKSFYLELRRRRQTTTCYPIVAKPQNHAHDTQTRRLGGADDMFNGGETCIVLLGAAALGTAGRGREGR